MRFPGKKTIRVRNRIPGLQLNSVEMYSGVYSVCLRTADDFYVFIATLLCVTEDAPLHLPAAEIGARELL